MSAWLWALCCANVDCIDQMLALPMLKQRLMSHDDGDDATEAMELIFASLF